VTALAHRSHRPAPGQTERWRTRAPRGGHRLPPPADSCPVATAAARLPLP